MELARGFQKRANSTLLKKQTQTPDINSGAAKKLKAESKLDLNGGGG